MLAHIQKYELKVSVFIFAVYVRDIQSFFYVLLSVCFLLYQLHAYTPHRMIRDNIEMNDRETIRNCDTDEKLGNEQHENFSTNVTNHLTHTTTSNDFSHLK